MRNLISVETKATLNTDAKNAIEIEIETLSTSVRIDIKSASKERLYRIINNCTNAAYQLGKIDGDKQL